MKTIDSAYMPTTKGRPIFFEYVSDYRRIVVLGTVDYPKVKGFEIRTEYKGFAKEFNDTWSTHWGLKSDAIAWAKGYSENRSIMCGNITIKENTGKQTI